MKNSVPKLTVTLSARRTGRLCSSSQNSRNFFCASPTKQRGNWKTEISVMLLMPINPRHQLIFNKIQSFRSFIMLWYFQIPESEEHSVSKWDIELNNLPLWGTHAKLHKFWWAIMFHIANEIQPVINNQLFYFDKNCRIDKFFHPKL